MTPWPLPATFPPVLAGCVAAILVYDAISAALVRRRPAFKYSRLWPLQFAWYVLFGAVAMFVLFDIRLAALIGALTGLVEGTVGWAITWRIGPGRQAAATPVTLAIAAASMAAFGFALALAGALLFNLTVLLVLRTKL